MIMNIEAFVKELNRSWAPPFLPAGFASAKLTDSGLILKVGPRDVCFDREDLKFSGSGSDMTGEWSITKAERRPEMISEPESEL